MYKVKSELNKQRLYIQIFTKSLELYLLIIKLIKVKIDLIKNVVKNTSKVNKVSQVFWLKKKLTLF